MSAPIAADRLPTFCFGRAPGGRCASALDFLWLVAKDPAGASRLAFEPRREQLAPWGEAFAATAAAAGFALECADPLRLQCVSCGAQVAVQQTEDLANDWAPSHNLGCQFDRLRALCSTPPPGSNGTTRPSLQTRRLKTHLRSELASAKAIVAREFSFDDDAICLAMARQFLESGRAFKDAGSLVDALEELTLSHQSEPAPLIEGMAELVQQLTPPAAPRRSPPPVTMRTTPPAPPSAPSAPKEQQVAEAPPAADLRRETNALLLRTRCKVCRERELHYLALPCSHLVFCETCQRASRRCPVCNEAVRSVVRTYTS